MQRTKFISILFLGVLMTAVFSMEVFAQGTRQPSSDKVLEYSLTSLKSRAEKISNRNDWLVKQSVKIQENMEQLGRQFRSLEVEADRLRFNSKNVQKYYEQRDQSQYVAEKGAERQKREVQKMTLENEDLEHKLDIMRKETGTYQERIFDVEKDIDDLQFEIGTLTSDIQKDDFEEEWERLVHQKKETERAIETALKELDTIQRRNAKPNQQVEALKSQQANLRQEIQARTSQLESLADQQSSLSSEINQMEGKSEEQSKAIEEDIESLTAESKRLIEVLAKAEMKLRGKNVNIEQLVQSEDLMKDNLKVVQRENEALKQEITHLREKLKDLSIR